MITEHLYFVAIIPPTAVKNEIQHLKEEFSNTYNVYHALKSPPHITLIPPFKIQQSEIPRLSEYLEKIAIESMPFNLAIEDYAAFKPRVIFLRPITNPDLSALYDHLNESFYSHFPVGEPSKRPFHPHLTIAFRDLNPATFRKAWQEYQSRRYQVSFLVDQIFLLKHNGKQWEEFQEFTLKKK